MEATSPDSPEEMDTPTVEAMLDQVIETGINESLNGLRMYDQRRATGHEAWTVEDIALQAKDYRDQMAQDPGKFFLYPNINDLYREVYKRTQSPTTDPTYEILLDILTCIIKDHEGPIYRRMLQKQAAAEAAFLAMENENAAIDAAFDEIAKNEDPDSDADYHRHRDIV